MISKISGRIDGLNPRGLLIKQGNNLVFEVRLTAGERRRVEDQPLGEEVDLYTIFYLESSGNNFKPVLVGFASLEDREFFELFTSVDGLGTAKALNALNYPGARVARAIAEGDIAFLTKLKGIGPRLAQKVVAALQGKVEHLVVGETPSLPGFGWEEDALDVLVQLGYSRAEAGLRVKGALRTGAQTVEEALAIALRSGAKGEEGDA